MRPGIKHLLFFFLVVFANIQNLFAPLFEAVGKDVTLSYRTVIWARTVNAISQNFVFGYGATGPGIFQTTVGLSPLWDVQASHAHNMILEMIFSVGIVGSLFYVYVIAKCYQKFVKCISIDKYVSRIINIGFVCMMILFLTDSYIMLTPFYLLLTICYKADAYLSDYATIERMVINGK